MGATAFCVMLFGLTAASADEADIFSRSLVSAGDPARLDAAMAKARRGEPVVVAVIGGSITAGAGASAEDKRWGNLFAQWWREAFPQAEIVFVNAGIGATGSDMGTHRAQAHLLCHQPDVVAVEYAVNDGGSAIAADTIEGLVRQILGQPNRPAAMLLFTMTNQGTNTQDAHVPVGRHYGLPMVSFRDALWPEIEAGRVAWTDIEADEVHPNDRGHRYCADFLTSILDRVKADMPPDDTLPAIAPLPPALVSGEFEHATFYCADTLTPVRSEGWEIFTEHQFRPFFGPGWRTGTPGQPLEFEVEGTAVSLIFYRLKGDMGIAEAQVDDRPPVKMDAWFGADWGGYMPFQLVARGLDPGPHRLRITVLDETSPESHGHEFRVHAVLTAGLSGAHGGDTLVSAGCWGAEQAFIGRSRPLGAK